MQTETDVGSRPARRWPFAGYESDPSFHELVARLGRSGLLYAGLLAIVLTVVHVGVHALVLGFDLTWSFDPAESPRTYVALWDKAAILFLGLLAIGLSRWPLPAAWSRLVAGVLLLVVCFAVLVDDVLNGDTSFSAAYFALVLLVAVNTIPFRPWQTFALGVGAIGVLLAGKVFLPGLVGIEGITVAKTQMVYMALVVVVLTAITSLLYRYRYEQFAARRSAEALNRTLEDRTSALEAEKLKTEEQARRLTKMEELKSRFFANITHQFRTPLTLILGPAQDALDERLGVLDPRLREQVELIHRNALGLQHLIDQLLDLSRLDADGMRLEPQDADLQAFLRSLYDSFTPLAERGRISFGYRTSTRELWTRFDPDKLEKAISNLLSNAFKFTPEGGKIRLGLRVGDAIEIYVRDSGPGVPEGELENIFDRFHQARGTGGNAHGSGIGLALARELIELHGGTISMQSEVGFGTHVTVTLPFDRDYVRGRSLPVLELHGDEPVIGGDLAPPPGLADAELPCILLIDDNDDVRRYVRSILEPGYSVLDAGDGRAGIEMARRHRPALIISDVMMPDVDGLEVCRVLKGDDATHEIPIVLLTARASEEAKIEGLEARADDYIYKPFSAAELLTRVENLIELRRMLSRGGNGGLLFAPSAPDVSSADEAFLEAVRSTIEEHMGNSNFGVEWLADEVALSARQLQRRLQASLRLSAAGVIRMMRLKRAAQLLERRAATISEIAYMVGFQDAAYFARLFKQTFGVNPSEYAARSEAAERIS